MAAPAETLQLTPEDFLPFEAGSDSKHDYLRGETFAIAGTTAAHNDVVRNLGTLIYGHLRGSPCRT